MKIKTRVIFMVLFFICSLCFAQEKAQVTPQTPPKDQLIEVIPLLTVTGRIVKKGTNTVLITKDAKGYLLEKKASFEEAFNKAMEQLDKDADVNLSGFDTRKTRKFRVIDHLTKQAKEEQYKILEVAVVNSVQPGSTVSNIDISKPVEYEATVKETLPTLKQISGTITKCNFKSVVPTIELEAIDNFALIITPSTQALKVIGNSLANFNPIKVLKVGTKVQVWYEEYGYLNTARTIIIKEKEPQRK